MTRGESAQLLGVSPKAGSKQVGAAYAALLREQTLRSQHATDPDERDLANKNIRLLRQAYEKFTGAPPPAQVRSNAPPPSGDPPRRVSLSGTGKPRAAPASPSPRRSIVNAKPPAPAPRPTSAPSTPPNGAARPVPRHSRTPGLETVWAWAIVVATIALSLGWLFGACR